ncbi:MAG TPA: GAF domain-containing protein, partial [Anaerolineae bacterium]|nr:GAF domain-containing protein [Anaerolineae bacterium]
MGPQIVLIDDEKISREGIADYLHDAKDYIVKSFADGRSGLRHIRKNWQHCSVVLLDLGLTPSMPGHEVLRKVRKEFPRIPVIVYSGRDPQATIQTLAQGAYAIMQGPLDMIELEKIVRGVFESDAAFMQMASDVRSLLHFDVGIAWRLDRQAHLFRVAGWSGNVDEAYRRDVTLAVNDPKWQQALSKGKPLLVTDVTSDKQVPAFAFRDEVVERGWRSLITIPLVYRDRIISLVDCYSVEPFQYRDAAHEAKIVQMLHAFANQAVAAVRHAELLLQSRALQELNQTMANTLEEDAILQPILNKAIELVGADFGWLYLLDAKFNQLQLRVAVGIPYEDVDPIRQLGEGITGWVADQGVLVSIPDVTKSELQPESMRHIPSSHIV